jgi:Tfp pilus assembly protein PilX
MMIPLIVIGLVLLIVLAIGVGASLDTTAQRRARRHVADERRMLAEAMAEWQDPRCNLCRGHLRRLESR